MRSNDHLKQAARVMTICNACRYCEGFCAVYPAMELRRTFTGQDLKYLANLCHNCRGCYYACQYAPPHEFAVNVPRTMAELRLDTYRESAIPGIFGSLFRHNGTRVAFVSLLSIALVALLTLIFQDLSVIASVHTGPNAFYRVIPYAAMVLPACGLALFVLAVLAAGLSRFWRRTSGALHRKIEPGMLFKAVSDTLKLKYLDGGGQGCNYPDDRFSMNRRWLHHLVFYGFLLCLASTTVAAGYDHFLNRPAPYPYLSWPVVLGTVGGLALLIGTGGLLYLKRRMDTVPTTEKAFGMDIAFLVLLFLTSLTGLVLLVLRETAAMGSLLVIHLGFVAGLFVTLPYGKFVHAIYRFAALVRNAMEQKR